MKNEDIYDLFVVLAIQGHMADADNILRSYKEKIYQVARKYSMKLPKQMTVYRGILLKSDDIIQKDSSSVIKEKWPVEYISFTENPEVARWFACKDAYLSDFVRMKHPSIEGFVIKYDVTPKDIIFHYSFFNLYMQKFVSDPRFVVANFLNNGIEPNFNQFLHNIKTQSEVMIKPTDHVFELIPVEAFPEGGHLSASQLDKKYLPKNIKS